MKTIVKSFLLSWQCFQLRSEDKPDASLISYITNPYVVIL